MLSDNEIMNIQLYRTLTYSIIRSKMGLRNGKTGINSHANYAQVMRPSS